MRAAIDDGDLRASAVIRNAATRLFAEHGAVGVTIRQIAAAAGVSPSLVIHHYGSKDGLRDAIDRRVAALVSDLLPELSRVTETGGSATLADLFAAGLEAEPYLAGYVRRMLVDGGAAADALFGMLFEATSSGLRSLREARVIRPASDERVRAAFLLVNDLATVLLRTQIEAVCGLDPLSADGIGRWTAEVMEVYAAGLFAAAADGEASGVPGPARPGTESEAGHRDSRH